jgi:DNA polymerase-1
VAITAVGRPPVPQHPDTLVELPELSRYDEVAVDTEGTGLSFTDRAVGLSLATPDGRTGYFRWAHRGGGNNVGLDQVRDWATRELNRPGLIVNMHNAGHDLRMLAYDRVLLPLARVEDTGVMAALHNELDPEMKLGFLAPKYAGVEGKSDQELNELCARHFGGAATRKAQAENYCKLPGTFVWEYAAHDARMTLALAQALRPKLHEEGLWKTFSLEMDLVPLLLRMHLVGVPVDVAKAEAVGEMLDSRLKGLRLDWERETGGANTNSSQQLAKLFDRWGLPYGRTPPSKNYPEGQASITKDTLEALSGRHPMVDNLKNQKKLDKLKDTFIDGHILGHVQPDGIIHTEFHATRKEWGEGQNYGTVSGRFSSANPNLQQIPKRDKELAKLIRGCFVPVSKEHRWVKLDYSQIEYRLLAHYGGGQLRLAYQEDPHVDFHQACAELTGIPRDPAKNINFGIAYGMGEELLAVKLNRPLEEAQEILATYHARLPEVRDVYRKADNAAADRGYIITWGYRKRRFPPNPYFGKERKSKKTGNTWTDRKRFGDSHKGLNALLQGSAADMMKMAMVTVGEIVDWESTVLHLTVHDELDLSVVRGEEGDRAVGRIKEAMEDMKYRGREPLTVPILAEADTGEDWGNLEPWKAAA